MTHNATIFAMVIMLIGTFLLTMTTAQTTPTAAAQCGNPPTLIPDTFSVSYQPIDVSNGVVFFTYSEPSWENWQMFDIRELASDPFAATFTISLNDAKLKFTSADCYFQSPQSYIRSNPVEATFPLESDANQNLVLKFTQSGTYTCNAKPQAENLRGRQQYSVTGFIDLRVYACDASKQPTAGAESRSIDAASKVSLPDLFVHEPCSRLTLSYDSTSQLTLRQTNGLALDITKLPTLEATDPTVAPRTVLMSYSLKQVPGVQKDGNDVYNNVLSFCTFNGALNSTFTPAALFLPGTDTSTISFNIKNSKIPSYCLNGEKDFDESDVDCGGNGQLNGCPPCVDASQICNGNSDCVSSSCQNHQIAGKRCAAISGSFGFGMMATTLVVATALLF